MKKITIVGRGLDPAKHLSLNAIRCLKAADIILGIEPETKSWRDIREEFKIREINNIGSLYKNGEKDLENYNHFINHVFAILNNHDNVVLLVAGHPRVGVTFGQILTQYKHKNKSEIQIEFIEGISSLDVMLNDLELDPLERGTAVIDANRALLFEYKLEPSINYFIYHACSVGTERVFYKNASIENKITLLQEYLLKFFDQDKVIYLCKASNGAKDLSQYSTILIKELSVNLSSIDFSTTLFIPANKPTSLNLKFFNSLQGISHEHN